MTPTIPNYLSVARVVAAPCVAIAFALWDRPDADRIAATIFIVAAVTDYLDGSLARSLDQETAFGRMLDPVADKAMVMISLAIVISLYELTWQILVPAVLIMTRELVIAGLREFLGDVKLEVTRIAKWKTTAQMVAIGMLLLRGAFSPELGEPPANKIIASIMFYLSVGLGAFGILALWMATVFTLVSGWDYLSKGMPHLRGKERMAAAVRASPPPDR